MPVIDGLPVPEALRQVPPRAARPGPEEDPVDHRPVIGPPAAAPLRAGGQEHPQALPFLIGQVMAIQSIKHRPDLQDSTSKIHGTRPSRADCVSPASWRTMRSIMMRRNRILIRDVPALLVALGRLRPATWIVDVEPLVVPWDSAPTLFANAANNFAHTARAGVPSVISVIYSSNSRCPRAASRKSCIRIATAARKPWQTSYLRDEPRPVAVAGDQVLTDGLLAWRLGASFLHWQVARPMPRWPRLQRWLARIAAPFLFKDEDGSST